MHADMPRVTHAIQTHTVTHYADMHMCLYAHTHTHLTSLAQQGAASPILVQHNPGHSPHHRSCHNQASKVPRSPPQVWTPFSTPSHPASCSLPPPDPSDLTAWGSRLQQALQGSSLHLSEAHTWPGFCWGCCSHSLPPFHPRSWEAPRKLRKLPEI